MRFIRVFVVVFALAGAAPAAPLLAQQAPAGQEEFVPMSEIPPEEQLPAAPMVVAAYAFVWVALLVYVVSLVRRVGRVEADLRALEREQR